MCEAADMPSSATWQPLEVLGLALIAVTAIVPIDQLESVHWYHHPGEQPLIEVTLSEGETVGAYLPDESMCLDFGIGYATPYLVNPTTYGINGEKAANLGVKVFFIWGSTCAGCFLFTYFFVPETRSLSLEQIDRLYRESTIVGSVAYRQKMLDEHDDGAAFGLEKHGEVEHYSSEKASV